MCGGKGERLKPYCKIEKPLVRINDIPMLVYVLCAILNSNLFDKIYLAISSNTPKTLVAISERYCNDKISILHTSGRSYSTDLIHIINYLQPEDLFIFSADLPLLTAQNIRQMYLILRNQIESGITSFMMTSEYVKCIGIKPSFEVVIHGLKCCYSGVTMIDTSKSSSKSFSREYYKIYNCIGLAVNVNTIDDLIIAKGLLNLI